MSCGAGGADGARRLFLRPPPLQLVIHPLCQTKIENLLGLNAALDAARFARFVGGKVRTHSEGGLF